MVSRAEIAMVWKLFRADAAHNRKRITLTVLALNIGARILGAERTAK